MTTDTTTPMSQLQHQHQVSVVSLSREELEVAHKKAIKVLEGEKRAAIKKAKALKGKKSKDAIEAAEMEYTTKLTNLEISYQQTVESLLSSTTTSSTADVEGISVDVQSLQISSVSRDGDIEEKGTTTTTTTTTTSEQVPLIDEEAIERERKLAKARKKREKQKENEQKLKQQIEFETANAGPSLRKIELDQLSTILQPLNLCVKEVEADGHCLYRAVAANVPNTGYKELSTCTVVANAQIWLVGWMDVWERSSTP
jgi:OTU domain-containing protein 6